MNKIELIEKAKDEVQRLHKEQDKVFSQLMKDLDIPEDMTVHENECIWDYCFNDFENPYIKELKEND